MKSLFTATVFLASIIGAFAQSNFSFNYNFFADYYSSRTNHTTPDGGFIQSGRSGSNLVLVKTDACYREEWSRSYNLGTGGFETSIKPLGNNGYVVATQTASQGFAVLRVDNAGNIVWAKRFQAAATLNVNAIDVDANNNIFVSGSYYRVTFDFDFFMMLLDANGNMLWNKTWGGGNGGNLLSWEQAYTGMATSDGGYLIAGTHHTVQDSSLWSLDPLGDNAVVLKLDASGNLQWARSFGADIYERIFDVQEIPGGFIFGGITSSDTYGGAGWDAYLLKISTDANGNFLSADWAKNIGHPTEVNSDDIFCVRYANNKIFAGGAYDNSENFIMAFDINGNDLGIAKKYSGFALHSIMPKADGGIVFIDHNSWSSMRIVKTDSLLQTANTCAAAASDVAVKNAILKVGRPGSRITFGVIDGGLQETDITAAITNGTLTVQRSNICAPNNNMQLNFAASSENICPGTCIDFNNLSSGNILCYEWNFSGANISNSNTISPANICYSQQGTYDVQLTAYDIFGSKDTLFENYIAVDNTSFLNVTGNVVACGTDSVTLTASGGNNYLWSNGATTASINVAAEDGAEYYVISNAGACEDSVGVTLSIIGNLPIANFTVTQQGLSIGFKNLSQNADTYEWDFGFNNATSNDVDPNYTYTSEGTYEICLTATNDCGSDIFCQTINITISSINEFLNNSYLLVYPNPVAKTAVVSVAIGELINQSATVSIIDLQGKIIHQELWNFNEKNQKVKQLPLQDKNLSEGVYQITLQNEKFLKSIKLIVI